ncbi:hypothetical protein ACYQSF_005394 [Klebsiella pneumoniae]
MPPAQPAADSEPDRNPVLAYADSYRDMAKQGVESVPIWSVITDLERNIAPLYRHAQPVPEKYNIGDATMRHIFTPTGMTNVSDMQAVFDRVEAVLVGMEQPAPVVPDDVLDALQKVARIRLDLNNFDGDRRGIADCLGDAEEALIEVVNRRAAMLHAGNSPANPDCWCRTCRPVVLNDMRFVVCPDCGNKRCPRANDHRNACTGSNEPGQEGSAYPDTQREVKP